MYTNLFKNQEKLQKRLNHPNLPSHRKSYNKKTKADKVVKYRGVGRKIYDLLYSFRNLDFIELKNTTIADKVGCDERTVQRWTARMVLDGLLIKERYHIRGVNRYRLILTKQEAYTYHLNTMTPQALNELTEHGTIDGKDNSTTFEYQTVVPIYSYINKYIYSTNRDPLTCARARKPVPNGCGFSQNQKERVVKGLRMLKKEQRDWIRKNLNEPNMAKVLENPEIKPHIITQDIQSIATLLDLSERERLKLIAFPDEVIKEVSEYVSRFMAGKVKTHKTIADRMGWLLGLAQNICQRQDMKPEWEWYFDICKIMNIKALEYTESKRPLEVPKYQGFVKKSQAPSKFGQEPRPPMYIVFKGDPVKVLSRDEEIVEIKKDIAFCESVLENPEKHFAFSVESSIKSYKNNIKSQQERLEKLIRESSN